MSTKLIEPILLIYTALPLIIGVFITIIFMISFAVWLQNSLFKFYREDRLDELAPYEKGFWAGLGGFFADIRTFRRDGK